MSVIDLLKTAPLGALIRVSNGQPKPHVRFNRKLDRWNHENFVGVLMAVKTAPGHRPTLTIREGEMVDTPLVVLKRYGVNCSLRFEIQRRPTPGSVRVLAKGKRELLHLAADREAAEAWRAASCYTTAVLEIVAEEEADVKEDAA